MRVTHDLRHHHRTRTLQVEVRAVKLAGAATSRITVTCNGQTHQFDTDQLAGVHVRAEDGNNTVRLDIEGSGHQGTTNTVTKTATQTARVKVNSTSSASGENA